MNDTNIILYKDIEFTNQNTIMFADKNKQTAYFNSKIFGRISQYEKIIVDSIAVSDYDYYQLQEVSYISTQRVIAGKTKTYYYRVIEIEYSNDGLTILNVNLDTIQTYMFDYNIESMFIEREHQNREGANGGRIFNKNPEPIEVSEYEYIESNLVLPYHKDFDNIYAAIVTVQKNPLGGNQRKWRYGSMEQNFKTLLTFFRYGDEGAYSQVGFVKDSATNKIENFADDNVLARLSKDPNVIDIWITPYIPNVKYGGIWGDDGPPGWTGTGQPYITGFHGYTEGENEDYEYTSSVKISQDSKGNYLELNVYGMLEIYDMTILEDVLKVESSTVAQHLANMTENLDYLDSKIYGSQYSSIELQIGTGTVSELYADEFDQSSDTPEFKFIIGNDIEKVMMVKPGNYNIPNKFISAGSENSLPRITDAFLEYMNNNRHSLQAKNTGNIVKSIVGIGVGAAGVVAATVATGGAAAPAAIAIAGQTISQGVGFGMDRMGQSAQQRDLKNKPDTFDNVNSIDFNIANNLIMARVRLKVPTHKEKMKLNDFFKLYGYNASYYGIPNLKTRKVFNYLKAGNMVITGKIPAIDKEELKQIYGAGIRLWHNPATFLNFEIDNDEVI